MKKFLALGVLVTAMAMPVTASAGCAPQHGSFKVSCENGVTVYRGQINSLRNAGPSAAQAQLKIAKMQQDTARRKIAADRATAREMAALRGQELDNQRSFARRQFSQSSSRYRNRGRYGYRGLVTNGFGFGAGNFGPGGFGRNGRGDRRATGLRDGGFTPVGRDGSRRAGRRGNATMTAPQTVATPTPPTMVRVGTPRSATPAKAMSKH